MNKILSGAFVISLLFIGGVSVPTQAHAATDDPVCWLIVSTPRGNAVYSGKQDVEIRSGERVIIGWIAQNADERTNRDGIEISNVGLEILSAFGSGTYTYTFGNGDEETTCEANLILAGSIEEPTTDVPTVKHEDVKGGSLAVSALPLLSGGIADSGKSVPVAYIRVSNPGSVRAAIDGFTLTQNGSAPVESVIGFSTSDDKGGSRASYGGEEGAELFDGDEAFIPLEAIIEPQQVRIFTIKALMSSEASGKKNSALTLDLTAVDSTADIFGSFPVRGVTWTLSF